MLFLAATALEKAAKVPVSFWFKIVGAVLAFLLVVVLLKKLLQVNKVILIAVSVVTLAVVGFSWIYERNEPEFLSPFVDVIAPFFPSKGAYQVRQQQEPDRPGSVKSSPKTTPASKH